MARLGGLGVLGAGALALTACDGDAGDKAERPPAELPVGSWNINARELAMSTFNKYDTSPRDGVINLKTESQVTRGGYTLDGSQGLMAADGLGDGNGEVTLRELLTFVEGFDETTSRFGPDRRGGDGILVSAENRALSGAFNERWIGRRP